MAKGLGAIMAEIALDREKQRLASVDVIICPLCKKEMYMDGAGAFCYGGPPHDGKCDQIGPAQKALGLYTEKFQQIDALAAIVVDNSIYVTCSPVRSRNGRTNIRLWLEGDTDWTDVPELIRQHGWVYLEELSQYKRQ